MRREIQMKLLYRANDRFEADLISDALTTHGIFSRIKFDEQGNLTSGMQFGEGLQVHVNDEDFDRASEILHEKAQPQHSH
ncbi:MAG: DUF2007 domain-containing protein [Proteobacteria bacterium]|nr:MAG: DUF2007 domain-containing protein [Pseudomonadota bacterium]